MRKIVVSGNCQMAVIVASLQLIFPDDEVVALTYVANPLNDKLLQYENTLINADYWLVISKDWAQGIGEKINFTFKKIVSFPNLEFRGFHPDQTYLLEPNSKAVNPIYYSSVLTAAYKMNFNKSVATQCFNSFVFEKLGYHDNYHKSLNALKWRFDTSDMKAEFIDYIRFCQKRWVFMHTINHPHVECIIWLAKLISLKIGAPRNVLDFEIVLPDLLSVLVWPVYPSIAKNLSLSGSFTYIYSNKALSLDNFIDLTYSQLAIKYANKSEIVAAPYFIELDIVESAISEFLKEIK